MITGRAVAGIAGIRDHRMGVFGFRPDVQKLETDRDVSGLIKALQYQDANIRLTATKSLSNFCSADACPALVLCLKDEDARIRDAAVNTLVATGESALPLLFNAMGDQSWLVRKGAALALTKLRWSPDDDEIKVCFLFAQGAWKELSAYKKKAIPYFIEGLKDENPDIRKEAAQALGTIADTDGFEPLTRAISDPDPGVRAPAALALGELKDPRAIPFLINLFYDSNTGIRNAAADALAIIGRPAYEPLIAALNDPKTSARLAAIRALGKQKSSDVIPPLIGKLEDAFPEMRSSAATALGEIGAPALPMLLDVMKRGSRIARLSCLDAFSKSLDDRVTEILVAASKEVDEQVAKKAESVLRKREGLRVWQTALEEDMVSSPTSSSTAEVWNIRQERKAFEQLGSQEMEKILEILRDDNQISRLRGILKRVNESRPVVEALVLIMRNKDVEIKRRAVEAINRLEGISGNPLLVALNDNDPFIRTVAARNLGRLGCVDALVPLLHHASGDKDAFVAGTAGEAITTMALLPNLKMPVITALMSTLTSDSAAIRGKSAELLGNFGSAVAVPSLINLFRDRDDTVVRLAAEALAEIGKQAFPALAQATYDNDPRTRCGSLTALAEFGAKGEAYVREALKDSNPDVRNHARNVLAALKNDTDFPAPTHAGVVGLAMTEKASKADLALAQVPGPHPMEALPDPGAIIPRLAEKDRAVRITAIKALVAMGEPAFLPLVFAVYNPDKALRIGALQALSRFGVMGAPYIIKALDDDDVDVQHSAYRLLNQLDGRYGLPRSGGPALTVGTPVDSGPYGDHEAPAIPPRQSPSPQKIYPADIIPRLADNSAKIRERAAGVLAAMGEPAFLPLVYAAYHPDCKMRIGALFALTRFGERCAPHIVKALEDPDLEVRHAVYRILNEQDGRWGLPRVGGDALTVGTPPEGTHPATVQPVPETPPVSLDGITDPRELAGYLDHPDKDVQMNAAMALAMMGGVAVPALIDAFAMSREARSNAAEVLGSLGPDAIGPLMEALSDTRGDVVYGAASVLGKLGDRRAVPALIGLLEKNDNDSGIAAAEALGYLGDSESVDALIRALNGTDSELQSGAARALGYIGDERAVSSLIEAMGSEDFSVRRNAIDALTGIGEGAVPYLTEALLHAERGVRSGAAECITQIGYTPRTEQERINLFVANEEWMEVARTGSSAVDVLVYFTDDTNDEVRAGAIAALGRAGGSLAVNTLGAILADDDPAKRHEAMSALVEMGAAAVPELSVIKEHSNNPVQQEAIDQIIGHMNRKTSVKTP